MNDVINLHVAKKVFTIGVVAATILWSIGIAAVVPLSAEGASSASGTAGTLTAIASVAPGSLVKAATPAVYYYGSDGKRYVFPNEKTYFTWYSDFNSIVKVSDADLATLAIGGNATYKPGVKMVKITTDPKVYAVGANGSLRHITSEAIAAALYGANWARSVEDVPDSFFVNYTTGAAIAAASDFDKAVVSAAATSINVDKSLTSTPSTPSTPVGGTGLAVALASDTPLGATLPDGSAYNNILRLNLTAGSDGDVKLTGLRVRRSGFSLNSDFTGIIVADATGKRHGNVVTLSDDTALIMFTGDPITILAGKTAPVWVQVNIDAAQTTNGTFAFSVTAATDVFTASSATISGSFPIQGSLFTVINGANTLGGLDVDAVTISSSNRNVDIGTTSQIGKFRLYAGANENITVKSVRLYNNGNATDADLTEITFKNDTSGESLGSATQTTDKYVSFTLNPALNIIKGQNKTVVIAGKVNSGATRTWQFILQNDYDITVTGDSTGGNLLATHATNLSGDATAGFPVGDAANYNQITAAQGSLTITKDNASPSGNVSQGQNNVIIGYWKLEAVGEDIEIQKADLEIGGTSVAADISGSVAFKIGDTTAYSTSTLATLLDGTVDGTDQKTLSNYYTLKAGTSVLATLVLNVASGATNANTIIGQVGDVYYKRLSTNNYATTSDNAVISANTLTIQTASLTVAKDSSFGDQNLVAGGANALIGSYLFQAGSSEGVNVSSINVDMSAITGHSNMKLKKVNADGTETQIGSTVSTPSITDDANSFSVGGQLNIAASSTVVVHVYTDTASTAVTANTDIDAADVTASGLSSGTALTGNIPLAAVTGQTITVWAGGTLLVETDTSTPREAVVHALESGRELLKLKFTSQYEALNITKLVFGSRRGNSNISSMTVTSGAYSVSTSPVDGVATFNGLTLQVPKDGTLIVSVKAAFTGSGTMISAEEFRVGLNSLEATGASSGARVYEMARTTTATVGDIASDTATALTVGSTVGFSVGDVVQVGTAQGTSAFTGSVTAVGSATSLTVAGPQNLDNCATVTCYVTKWATREAVTSTTTAVTLTDATAIAIDVTSTRGFAVGDIVRIEGLSGATDDGGFYTVTGITDGNTMTVIGVGEVTASPTIGTTATDRITRMATTTSTQTDPLGSVGAQSIVANTASTLTVGSTAGLAVGDVVVLNSTASAAATRQIYVVSAVPSATTVTLIGTGAQTTIPDNSWLTELATTRTTTVSTASTITADTASAVTLTSTAGFAVGDIVSVRDDATAGGDIYMVSAVSTTTITVIGETGFVASAGAFVTQLASSTGNSAPFTVHDIEPVLTLNSTSPGASGTVSGATNQIVAIFDVQVVGDSAVNATISALTVTRGGNIGTRVATTAQPKIYDYSSSSLGALLGTGADWSGTTAGSTSAITLDTPFTITAGQTAKIAVTVNTASASANDTFQAYVDNTGGLAGLFGGLSWYYTAVSPSPGTEPTNASPSTLADTYPVYGNTLRY